MSAYLYDPTTSTDFESSEAYTTNSKGFEISESDADDRLEMEDKLLQVWASLEWMHEFIHGLDCQGR